MKIHPKIKFWKSKINSDAKRKVNSKIYEDINDMFDWEDFADKDDIEYMEDREFDDFYSQDNWDSMGYKRNYDGTQRNKYGRWDMKTHFYEMYSTGGRGFAETTWDWLKNNFPSLPEMKCRDVELIYWAIPDGRDYIINHFPAAACIYDHTKNMLFFVTPNALVDVNMCYDSYEGAMDYIRREEDRRRGEITIMTKEQVQQQEEMRKAKQFMNGQMPGGNTQHFEFRFG